MAVSIALCTLQSRSRASTFSVLNTDFLGRGGHKGLVANAGDMDDIFWNASGLAFAASSGAAATYMDYLVDVGGGVACYMAGGGTVGYGIHVSYLSSGTYARTAWDDPAGEGGDTFTHGEFAMGMSAGMRVRPYLAFGSGIKFGRYELDGVTGSGIFADLSATARIYALQAAENIAPGVYVTLVTRNLPLVVSEDTHDGVPRNAELGFALKLPGQRASTGLSFYFGRDGRREARFGFSALLSSEFEARLGYRRRIGRLSDSANDLPWERGIMAGFGIGFGRFWVDYTLEDASPLDNIHRFGLRALLGPRS